MIYLLSGIPGSGKSTFINMVKADNDIVISRDEIRFSMLKENEDYFAYEKEVLQEFKRRIIEASHKSSETCNIFIDATHISKKVRKRVLSYIPHNDVFCIYFKPDIEKAIEHNNKRTGREKVPEKIIIEQAMKYEEPSFEEGFKYILEVKNENVCLVEK